MSDNTNEPILPIPSDLNREMAGFYEQINQMRDQLNWVSERYVDLAHSPQSLAVDNLGEPIEPIDANGAVLTALEDADQRLYRVEAAIDEARKNASRLKLTDQADQERERRLAEQRANGSRRRSR
ncbi:hypothetical protein OG563_30500 [Nocardia vinacea]|uniref:PE family protein n=1 Tax=Nocardia vinacea TaxID=96468 RepID=A0ABZ1YNI4_9NOCA|nr:hypothetical protein [Nocardia vinacea]